MFKHTLFLGRIFGIAVDLDYSWFFIFALLTWVMAVSYYPGEFPYWGAGECWLLGAVTSVLLFLSVLLHELGHSVVAMHFGIPVPRITLFLFGGVSQIAEEPSSAFSEFWLAISDPIVSLLLALLCWELQPAFGGLSPLLALAKYMALLNFILAIFNLIPGFPLDGGRVLRAILWGSTKNFQKASTIAAVSGQVFGYLLIFAGVWLVLTGNFFNGLWIAFIGWYLESAAKAQMQHQMLKNLLGGHKVSEMMTRDLQPIPADTTLQELVEHHVLTAGRRSFVVSDGNGPAGLVTLSAVKDVPRSAWPATHVSQVMIVPEKRISIRPNTEAWTALEKMGRDGVNQLPVVLNGGIVGMVSRDDVLHLPTPRTGCSYEIKKREAQWKDKAKRFESKEKLMENKATNSRPLVTMSVIMAVLLVGAYLGTHVKGLSAQNLTHASKVALKINESEPPLSLSQFKDGFASAIVPALPAVVNISSTKVVKRQMNVPNFFDDPFFRQFFGDQFGFSGPQTQTEKEYALGSGVIVNPDGYILTNNHVVSGASDIQVFTRDKRKYVAKVIGTDPRTDIAVLKISATSLPTLALGDSSKLKVGDIVFAIGDPLGIGETATMGIVSATGRGLGGAIEHYEDFIQTDAAINPGNSGGALIEAHGNLIGINTAILAGNGGGNEGIGFAIPINMARNVMEQIIDHGKVTRGYLGVTVQGVDPDMAKAFGLSHGGGALVGDIKPDGPAARAGIERGDIILDINGQPVNSQDDLSVHISEMAPGTRVHLTISRNGQTRDIAVTLGEYPEENTTAQENGGTGTSAALAGVQVQNLTPTIARELKIPSTTRGVVVTGVDPSSAAAAAGVQQGDVIQDVNRQPVHNVTEYEQALKGTGKQSVLLLVNRGGTTYFVVVQPQ